MKKKVLVFSILCLLFITINYTYSSFQNTIVGNISATSNNWRFAVNVTNGIKENDYFKVPIGGTSGQVSVTLNTTNSSNNVKYSIELSGYNLPSDIKYYKDSSYSTLISNNLYSDTINKNTSKTITIYAEMIKLHQKDLGVTIDVPNNFLDKIENIEINGYKFIKDKSDE